MGVPTLISVIRGLARIGSVASTTLLLLFVIGSAANAAVPSTSEILGLVLFPIGVAAGMLVGWRAEFIGGVIAIGSLAGFYLWHLSIDGSFPRGPYFLLLTLPGGLFLITGVADWALRGKTRTS